MWNHFMEELTGLAAAYVLGRRAVELFPHLEGHGIDRLLQQALAGERVCSPDIPFHVPATDRGG